MFKRSSQKVRMLMGEMNAREGPISHKHLYQ